MSQLDIGIEDRGLASWYGAAFHGKRAADGNRFDMEALTAAHRTLPLGSVVRVVNLVNGKHLHIRITDRGPYVRNRVIDLSRAAADRLGMIERGVSVVRIQLVGERWPLAYEAMETVCLSFILCPQQTPSVATGSISSSSGKSNPLLVDLLRIPPSDIWIQQRMRRSRGMPTAEQPDPSIHDTEV